ncbi:DUF3846 domain-containing protein [Haloplasma contractile]|uniref:DUF3846 domain-containing protein n=1 Tax=Haloplasma contractile SSD-17B TaxID=1033810 RepID=F7PT65_9MOLU|nr:hypothetical protein [Haloplasma contractile]ERJ12520.1 hypothetical protein HLPCO_001506 [Haloplasma contractile SSD-17B]
MKKGILIKRTEDQQSLAISVVEINKNSNMSELHQIYKHLGVNLIDIVSYRDKSIYIDDEGLLKAEPQLTMLLNDTNQYLYGNVLIMGPCDEEGETLGISIKDADS